MAVKVERLFRGIVQGMVCEGCDMQLKRFREPSNNAEGMVLDCMEAFDCSRDEALMLTGYIPVKTAYVMHELGLELEDLGYEAVDDAEDE